MKKYTFEKIKERLIAKVPELKTIGLFNNQFEKESENNPIGFPALFVEFDSIDWRSQQRGIQIGLSVIRFHIGVETYKTNFSGEQIWEPNDLEFLELVEKIHVAIHGFDDVNFTPLLRVAESQNTDHDNVIVWDVVYQSQITDTGAETRFSKPLIEVDPDDIELIVSSI